MTAAPSVTALLVERDEARAALARMNRRAQIAEAAINELTNGTGRGKSRAVALEIWTRCVESHGVHCPFSG